jgi:hypothetical protein
MESNTVTFSKEETISNLRVIIGSGIDSHEMIRVLDEQCRKEPVDIIIIDSFGDTFAQFDGNSNSQIRNALKPFGAFVQEHECLILFLAHVNKSAYFDAPTQSHVQGASAFPAKTRVVLDMRVSQDDPAVRYLCVTKGNYVAPEYKTAGREIRFHSDTFLNEYTGVEVPKANIGRKSDSTPGGKAQAVDWLTIFGTDIELSIRELAIRVSKAYGLADRQSRKYVYDELESSTKGRYMRPTTAHDVTPYSQH